VGFRVLSYKWIVESVRDWADQQDQFSITETLANYDLPSCSGVWLWTFTAPDVFSQLMVCREPGRPDEATIRIAAGGAVGIPEHPAVYQYVATQAWEYPYGAFFARCSPENNTIGVSGRLCLDGRILETSPVGSGFVVAMARILGQEGRDIGLGLVRSFGGRLHDGTQESDPTVLTTLTGIIQLPCRRPLRGRAERQGRAAGQSSTGAPVGRCGSCDHFIGRGSRDMPGQHAAHDQGMHKSARAEIKIAAGRPGGVPVAAASGLPVSLWRSAR